MVGPNKLSYFIRYVGKKGDVSRLMAQSPKPFKAATNVSAAKQQNLPPNEERMVKNADTKFNDKHSVSYAHKTMSKDTKSPDVPKNMTAGRHGFLFDSNTPPPSPPPQPPQSSDKSLSDLLKKAEDANLIRYEDTFEAKSSGATRLTTTGHDFYKKIMQNDFSRVSSINEVVKSTNDQCLEAGLIKPAADIAITLAAHEHFVVVVNPSDSNTLIVKGILTSEKKQSVTLSENQPLSGNEDKAQNIRIFSDDLIINKENFQLHKKATENEPNVLEKIKNCFEKTPGPRNLRPYDNEGVTLERLEKMLEANSSEKHYANQQAENKPKILLNSLQQEKLAKMEKKKAKMHENEKKQKEDALNKKLNESEHDLENNES
ncbi:MAG: hypothetical protein HRT73_11040 [Flavobacteriales bacterium]|nr:hypothetical protein [Flavobacteriales bacterium]